MKHKKNNEQTVCVAYWRLHALEHNCVLICIGIFYSVVKLLLLVHQTDDLTFLIQITFTSKYCIETT
jgi:hypothetical protein